MIDKEGFRQGIGIILVNAKRQVFLAKRIGKEAWQFPQGGIQETETIEQTMYRELYEEIGLKREDIKILSITRRWYRYRLPKSLIRHYSKPICVGQKQKWFLLQLVTSDAGINLAATENPEFDAWEWVNYWYPLTQVIAFKRRVYHLAMKEFARVVLSKRFLERPSS